MIPRRLKHGLFFLAYLLVTVALIFGVLEITTRARHQAPRLDNQYGDHVSDPYLPYKPKPSITHRGHSPTDEFDYVYAHNSFGFRDVEHTYEKPPGTFRIVGLGDSFTYGAGALFEDTYLARLEETLNARGGGGDTLAWRSSRRGSVAISRNLSGCSWSTTACDIDPIWCWSGSFPTISWTPTWGWTRSQ
jgi:hypothetical protein